MGKAWKGNSITDEVSQGIGDHSLDYWSDETTSIEINYINKLVPHILEKYYSNALTAGEV